MAVPTAILGRVRGLRSSWASLTDSDLLEASTVAEALVSVDYFGAAWADAMVYAIAHLYLIESDASTGGATSGSASSISNEQRSISFQRAASENIDAFWSQSAYGRIYLVLLQTRIESMPEVIL